MSFHFGTRSQNNIEFLRPDLRLIAETGLTYGIIDYGVPNKAHRTKQEQADLYAKGRTKPGEKVTWTLNSNHIIDEVHGYSNAVDVVPYVDGFYSWDEEHCLLVATCMFRAAMDLGYKNLQWGYHLWKKDMPHFQILTPLEILV